LIFNDYRSDALSVEAQKEWDTNIVKNHPNENSMRSGSANKLKSIDCIDCNLLQSIDQ